MADEWDALVARGDVGAQANYLYYIQRAYGKRDAAAHRAWARADADAGIHRFDEPHSLDISAQVIEICRLDPGKIDPRLAMPGLEALADKRRV